MTNPKVFEYAKEVGLTPLALMDKIREWKLPVKSHMAELEPEVLAAIDARLKAKPEGAAKPATVKRTVKAPAKAKSSPAKSTSEVVAPVKASTAQRARAAEAARVATGGEPAPTVAVSESAKAAAAASSVVRRKKTSEILQAKAETLTQVTQEPPPPVIAPGEVIATAVPVVKPTPVAPPPVVPVQVAATPSVGVPSIEVPARAPSSTAPVATPAAEDATDRRPLVARKKEVAIGASGVASQAQAPAMVRKNIVGRMDLSRVNPPPGSVDRGGFRGPGAAGTGPRSKGNLRAGFVHSSVAISPAMPPPTEDSRGRRGEKRGRGLGGLAEPVIPGKELEEQPPQFDAAEFRKREMVFQPKKKKGMLARPAKATVITQAAAHKRVLKVFGSMKVADCAMEMGLKANDLIKVLIKNGVVASLQTELDFETIALVVPELGWEAKNVEKTAVEVLEATAFGDLSSPPVTRPPVVTVMGHVDHGKTSLLDAIRSANVAAKEAGGITQHIGAYQVKLESGKLVTFLDTPGHEAFTAMRARGANVTDIAVIVVAADDGVMPQTAEAINHAKAAGVPIIVAINKMDKPGANPERIKQQLTEFELVPEEWGGTTIFVPVSALKKTGVKELLEQILLVAEVEDLKANPGRSATGTVVEARLDKGRGPVATLLVADGTLKIGQHIVAGIGMGKVKSLTNDRGERVNEATPGMPIEVLGLDVVPNAGDRFDIVVDEKSAEEAVQIRKRQVELAKISSKKVSLEELFSKAKQGDVKDLPVVLKADVAGSLEALQGMFQKLSSKEVKTKVIHTAIGGITESDVLLASTAKGIVIGFNVRPDSGASAHAKRLGVEIRTYSIVYELVDDMKKAMQGMLAPSTVEKVLGKAEVRNTFSVAKVGTIAGSFVTEGKVQRSAMARLVRDGKIIYEGKISSLKRFKDDAREVLEGFECGIGIENFNDVKVGDVIEIFVREEVQRELTALDS